MTNRTKTRLTAMVAATVTTGLLSPIAVGLVGEGASATGCTIISESYKSTKGKAVWKPTKLSAGHYQKGGSQSITYARGKQRATSKGSSDSLGGSGGASFGIFQASADYNHTWNRNTTNSTTVNRTFTSHSRPLPKKAFTRWTLYHKAYQFTTTLTVTYNTLACGIQKHRFKVVVPTKSWSERNIHWDVQYQAHPNKLR